MDDLWTIFHDFDNRPKDGSQYGWKVVDGEVAPAILWSEATKIDWTNPSPPNDGKGLRSVKGKIAWFGTGEYPYPKSLANFVIVDPTPTVMR